GETSQVVREDTIGFSALQSLEHVREQRPADLVCRLVLDVGIDHGQAVAGCVLLEETPLGFSAEDLPIFTIGRFATVEEVFHGVESACWNGLPARGRRWN